MKIAFCYQDVLPAKGGCATYIADLSRRLVADDHQVHLYASQWDETALPADVRYHRLPSPGGPRFLRPWRFARACDQALLTGDHDVSVGFDKTWGQDVLYPQGGLHVASAEYNLRKFANPLVRGAAWVCKWLDLAHWSYCRLERKQYLGHHRPLVVVNSEMVRDHFQHYYGVPAEDLVVIRSAINPDRFIDIDRPRRRIDFRQRFQISAEETVGLFVAMNYRLKGLEPLLYAVRQLRDTDPELCKNFRLLVVGQPSFRGYANLAQRLGVADRVCFIGPYQEMRDCYFASDFLVHPTFYDPCSLVVLEALACALPVITSKYNGASELLKPPREGLVVKNPHDHTQLGWCLKQMLDPRHRASCAQAARKAAGQWTFENHYRMLVRAFQEAAARRQAA